MADLRAPGARLVARALSFSLPSGRVLFEDTNLVLTAGYTAMIGRNGVGKSTLLELLAGDRAPTAGHVERCGRVVRLPAHDAPADRATVLDLLGLASAIAALDRLEHGLGTPDDLILVDERWDLAARLAAERSAMGLAPVPLDAPATRLSSGERQQVRLLGALLRGAEVLLLDEPSRFLDREASRRWFDRVRVYPGAVLAVSHDPAWLDDAPRLIELTASGGRSFDGGLAHYRDVTSHECATHARAHAEARRERRSEQLARQRRHDQLVERVARGRRAADAANLPRILLGRRKERAERFHGREHEARQQRLDAARARVTTTWAALGARSKPEFVATAFELPASRRVLSFTDAHPCASDASFTLDATLSGPVRIALTGANGSGKSTLLEALATSTGALARGQVQAHVGLFRLDAQFAAVHPQASADAWLAQAAPALAPATRFERLALLGLDGERAARPMTTLSSGKRVRAALAAAAYGDPPQPLLLLDEPEQHLDFESRDALRDLLLAWPGAYVVVSHDEAFLAALALTHRIELTSVSARLTVC